MNISLNKEGITLKLKKEDIKRKLEPGDKIICKSQRIEIAEILYQNIYKDKFATSESDKSYIDIEFKDVKGEYRHWKSSIDGGCVEYNVYLPEDPIEREFISI